MNTDNNIAEIAYMYRVNHQSMTEKETPVADIFFIAVPMMWITWAFDLLGRSDVFDNLPSLMLVMTVILMVRILISFYENWFALQGHH